MALLQLDRDAWRRSFSRILWNGPPLSGKTTGTLTLPRPCHNVVAPGELGHSSVEPTDDYKIYAWEYDPSASSVSHGQTWQELNTKITEIMQGKYGPVQSLVIDGLHKLYTLIMKSEGWTSAMVDDKESGKQYTKYHDKFSSFVARLVGSGIPMVGATCYDGLEALDPTVQKPIMQVYPMLPGQMAKLVMGAFPVVVHTKIENGRYYWVLKPQGKMQAAGMHIPTRYLAAIPNEIEVKVDAQGKVTGGWQELERILAKVGEAK